MRLWCYKNLLLLTINVEHLTKSVNRKWISDSPELGTTCKCSHNTKYQEAVICSCWENCYGNFLPFTINVENLTKSENRKWMSHIPEIISHGMWLHVNAVYQISRGCELLRKLLWNIPTIDHYYELNLKSVNMKCKGVTIRSPHSAHDTIHITIRVD
jgi:hypothetical protein